MLRRERSYEGISFQAKTVPVDRVVADDFSAAMRAIKDFDRAKQKAVKAISKEVKAEAKALGEDGAIGDVGAKSTNFTSLMHNCIEQGLLAQKADATVEEAIAALNRGEKPVITLANTMGSFIQAYAESQDLSPGDAMNLSFGDLLERYWRWYGAAVALGRLEVYLSRITEVAREVAKGNALSEKAIAAMQRDFNSVLNTLPKQTLENGL